MRKQRSLILWLLLAGMAACMLALLVPGVRSRAEGVWLLVRARFAPVDQEIFIPEGTVNAAFQATVQALIPTSTITPSPVPVTATPTPVDTPVPTPTVTPLPAQIQLEGVTYFSQHDYWNYCAPANLAMALSYWGWQGTLPEIGAVVKPGEWDKNVMPYELEDYTTGNTNLKALTRSGGTLALLKTLIASGFPVVVEKGVIFPDSCNGGKTWMGHYQTVVGYDDAQSVFFAYDSFTGTKTKPAVEVPYAQMQAEWRAFNYIFLLVYSPDREGDLVKALGEYVDYTRAEQIAAEIAAQESAGMTSTDQFFAYYNLGSSRMHQGDYGGAAAAYDAAYQMYESLPKPRPFRMTWYQTGPYFAYFNTGRFQDVIDLADNTLADVCISSFSKPGLEETWIWRARAKAALGDTDGADEDLRQSLYFHPNFQPALDLAAQLGVQP